MSRAYPLAFYNVDNDRNPNQVEKEIRALLDPRPAVLGLCETGGLRPGNGLPQPDDYRILRDASKPGRENLVAYVKTNLAVSDVKWHDCHETWTRTNPGATGQHWPRSILEFRAGRLFVMVAHQPPKGTDNTKPAQWEGIDKLTARMAPWTRDDWDDRTQSEKDTAKAQIRVVIWDANRTPDEDGPGPGELADRIDGDNAGGRIDLGTYRGGEVKGHQNVKYPEQVAGVELCSDHGHSWCADLIVTDN